MGAFQDMELDDEDKLDAYRPIPMAMPDYPCGLRICLTHKELAKLDLDADCEPGDYLMMAVMARVTSCSSSDGPGGPECRTELQIEKIKLVDDGDNDEDDE